MFDTHHVHRHATTVHKTVEEKRAPTDESVRLLREMEAAAQKSIIDSTRVRDTHIDCVLHKMRDALNCSMKFAVIYSLNGQKHRVNHESFAETREDILIEVRDALAKHIATQLLSGVARDI